MRLHYLLCVLTLLAQMALPVQAQWKWKDSRGQVHISDLPPPREVQDKDILQRAPAPGKRATITTATTADASAAAVTAAPAASAAAPRPNTDPELEARRKVAEADQKTKAKAAEEKLASQRAENCQRARQYMATLQSGQRIARINAQGEREILDDKVRDDETAATRRMMESDCR